MDDRVKELRSYDHMGFVYKRAFIRGKYMKITLRKKKGKLTLSRNREQIDCWDL